MNRLDNAHKLQYTGIKIHNCNVVVIKHNSIIFSFPGIPQFRTTQLPLKSELINSILNVTIANYSYFGEMDTHCLYGGVSFFEHGAEIKNTFSLCNTIWSIEKNIYFNSSEVLVIFYSDKEYSSTTINFQVSMSQCILIKIIPCEPKLHTGHITDEVKYHLSLYPSPCSLIQVSSGLYEINDNVEKNVAKRLMITYPVCVPLFLTIDQSVFDDNVMI